MNSKHLVIWGITTALIGSNIVISKQYINDSTQYKNTITQQTKLIEKYKKVNGENNKLINQQVNEINKEKVELTKQQSNMNNINKQLNQLKEENVKLKKAYDERKKVIKSNHKVNKPKISQSSYRTFVVTYYTDGYESTQKQIGDKGYGITASGTRATEGRTIAAPASIPFGTKVYIEGLGVRIVEDRGNAITNGHIDVYVNSASEAKRLGKQRLKVKIIG